MLHYIRRGGAHSSTHIVWSLYLTTSSCTLSFSFSLWARQELLGELVSLEEENLLGMNTIKSSSKFLLSYHSYSSAYGLDYSFRLMIMIYELVYSLCVMILTCKTLCLIIHITYMSRIRAKLRWWFIMPLGGPKFFTCRSVGSGTRGNLGSFYVR